jgi:subtilisin family serine protease
MCSAPLCFACPPAISAREELMLRSLAALLTLFTLSLSLYARPASAANLPKGRTIDVMIQLKGQPVAADTALKARNANTRYRLRFDPDLSASKWYTNALSGYQSEEISYLKQQGVQLAVGRRFELLFNGFSASVPQSELGKLRSSANVAAVLPEKTYRPLDDHSVPLINGPGAWAQLGGAPNAGKGILIAQLDTGIDIKSACFSDTGMTAPSFGRRGDTSGNLKLTNNKVVIARAFGSDPNKHYSAADKNGHGTFGAAIEACDYNTPTPLGTKVSGVAPAAWLGNYNIFPANAANTSDSQVLAAMEAALLDGADVINMSFGAPAGDPSLDAESEAVNLATQAGVDIVISAGNAGPTTQSVGSPAAAPSSIAVGSVTNSRGIYSSVTAGGTDNVPAALTHMQSTEGSHNFTGTVGPAQAVYVGLARLPNDDPTNQKANDLAGKDLHGKIALIQRGTTTFETKLDNVAAAGAIGAVVFDNRQEVGLITMDQASATLPAMFISQDSGNALLSFLQAHPNTTLTLNSAVSAVPETPDILSDFSSRGYGDSYSIKPDLVAPGQDIYSATESESASDLYNASGWASAQGTSFSAPHVTGSVALVLQKHPKWTPTMVKAALMNTAAADVSLDPHQTEKASVMDDGAGMVNVGAAVSATALVIPSSLSFGAVNTSSGAQSASSNLALSDVGGGNGAWEAAVQPLHGNPNLSISLPGSVNLPAQGQATIRVHLAVPTSVPNGDYDGYFVFTSGSETLHVPYFVKVASQAITKGSVLLVDGSYSRFQAAPNQPPIVHENVAPYFEKALHDLGKTYTYWNLSTLGTPSLQDMKQASAVIVFTGNNLNGFAAQNSDPEALLAPLSSGDLSVLHSYVNGGGRLFVSGEGAALSDPYWTAIVMGSLAENFSMYDDKSVDPSQKGGVSPLKPSAVSDTPKGALKNAGIFAGLKPIDFSTRGDGAHDNLAVNNTAIGLVGVSGLAPLKGNFGQGLNAFGHPALKATSVPTAETGYSEQGINVGVTSSDEPSFTKRASFNGRTVLFSFGFEGINNNTGYATRDQVLSRIFAWFNDHPTARVVSVHPSAHTAVKFKAQLRAGTGVKAVAYQWQVNGQKLATTSTSQSYRFPHAGRYQLRVMITDSLGHVAISPAATITVS